MQEVDGSVVRFLIDAEAEWCAEADGRPLLLSLADPKCNAFVSVTGTARVTREQDAITRLYDKGTDAFFVGQGDPRLRLLTVTAESGEWWDGPSGRLGQVLALAKAHLTNDACKVVDAGVIDVG